MHRAGSAEFLAERVVDRVRGTRGISPDALLDGGHKAGSFPGDGMESHQEHTELWGPNFPPACGSMRSKEGE